MNAQIHKEYGYIIGGVCDKEHGLRKSRVDGAWKMFHHLVECNYFKIRGKRYTLKREPYYNSVEMYTGMGAQYEIGGLRFAQDVCPKILKRRVNYASIERWIEQECAPASGISYVLGKEDVMSDDIYQKRIARGEIK